jgi:hypothetical protein
LRQSNYWCILNKNAEKYTQICISVEKYVQKHWRIQKTSAHPKSLVDGKNSSAYENIGVHRNVGAREKLGARQGWPSRKTRRPPMLAQQKN